MMRAEPAGVIGNSGLIIKYTQEHPQQECFLPLTWALYSDQLGAIERIGVDSHLPPVL